MARIEIPSPNFKMWISPIGDAMTTSEYRATLDIVLNDENSNDAEHTETIYEKVYKVGAGNLDVDGMTMFEHTDVAYQFAREIAAKFRGLLSDKED